MKKLRLSTITNISASHEMCNELRGGGANETQTPIPYRVWARWWIRVLDAIPRVGFSFFFPLHE